MKDRPEKEKQKGESTMLFVVRYYRGLEEINYLLSSEDFRKKFCSDVNDEEGWTHLIKMLQRGGIGDWAIAGNDTFIVYDIRNFVLGDFLKGKYNTDPIGMILDNRAPNVSIVSTIEQYTGCCRWHLDLEESTPEVVAFAKKHYPELVSDVEHAMSFEEAYQNLKLKLRYDEVLACKIYLSTGLTLDEILEGKLLKAEDLSPEELERAFRIKDRQYMKEDARNILETNGFSEDEITDDLLDRMVDLFEDYASMEESELSTWDAALQTVLAVNDEEAVRRVYQSLLDGKNVSINDLASVYENCHLFARQKAKIKDAINALLDKDFDAAKQHLNEALS